MSEIAFIPELKKFLLRVGTVYTVRRFQYRTREVYVEGVGNCVRDLVRRVNESRFGSLGEDMWLYKVVVKR